jgi:drug/metabolite transporter (DMT)-like permease
MERAYLAISIVTLFWAGNFTAGKIATAELDPHFIAAVRVFLTASVFYALLPRAERKLERSDWKAILPLSVSGVALNQIFFAMGIQLTTPSHSAVVHALMPAIVAVMAWVMIRERLGPLAIGGLAVAVAGALWVVLGTTREEIRGTLLGDVLTFAGVLAFSYYMVQGRRTLEKMGSFRAVTFAFVLGAPLLAPSLVYGVLKTDWARVTWRGWAALGYMFLFANLVCYRLHIFSLSRLKAGQVAVFSDFQPALGIAIAVLAGKDRLTPELLAGATVALAGIVLVQVRSRAAGEAPS